MEFACESSGPRRLLRILATSYSLKPWHPAIARLRLTGNPLMVNDGIRKRVAELKVAQSQKSELSRDELRKFLTEVILTPAGKVDEQIAGRCV